jgi:hypothetical protein
MNERRPRSWNFKSINSLNAIPMEPLNKLIDRNPDDNVVKVEKK